MTPTIPSVLCIFMIMFKAFVKNTPNVSWCKLLPIGSNMLHTCAYCNTETRNLYMIYTHNLSIGRITFTCKKPFHKENKYKSITGYIFKDEHKASISCRITNQIQNEGTTIHWPSLTQAKDEGEMSLIRLVPIRLMQSHRYTPFSPPRELSGLRKRTISIEQI